MFNVCFVWVDELNFSLEPYTIAPKVCYIYVIYTILHYLCETYSISKLYFGVDMFIFVEWIFVNFLTFLDKVKCIHIVENN